MISNSTATIRAFVKGMSKKTTDDEAVPQASRAASSNRPDDHNMESKIDSLTYQIANLTLIVKKISSLAGEEKKKGAWKENDYGTVCSYCKDPGHIAGSCEKKPKKNHRCDHWGNK